MAKSLAFLAVVVLCTGVSYAEKPTDSEPITIEIGNMKSEKPRLLGFARQMSGESDTSNTLTYANNYIEMMRCLKTVGTKNLSQQEVDLILSISEPTDTAMEMYYQSKQAAIKRVEADKQYLEKWIADKEAARIAAEKAVEEQRKQAEIEQREQAKVDAMNRQAAAQEKMAKAANRRNYLQERVGRYY